MRDESEIKAKLQEIRKKRDSAGCQSSYAQRTFEMNALLWVLGAKGDLT